VTLTPDERYAVERWVRAVAGMKHLAVQMDAEVLPVLQRLLDEAGSAGPDPYAGRRTMVRGEDVIGGRQDRGITRKSERNG